MTQQTLSVGGKPRVIITQWHGNLNVQSWKEPAIRIELAESSVQVHQEGETLSIAGAQGNIQLLIPNVKMGPNRMLTDISVADFDGNVSIEGAGSVNLLNISGTAELTKVEGHLDAENIPTLRGSNGIGGEVRLSNISRIEIDAVGAGLSVVKAELVNVKAVGGQLDADQVGAQLQCSAVGGSCVVRNSSAAEIAINNVGGNLDLSGVARMHMCNVGGNLNMFASFPTDSNAHLMVGGNASLTLPDNANMAIHAMVGGQIRGEALGSLRVGSIAKLVYGEGAAKLSLTVGGNLTLHGNSI